MGFVGCIKWFKTFKINPKNDDLYLFIFILLLLLFLFWLSVLVADCLIQAQSGVGRLIVSIRSIQFAGDTFRLSLLLLFLRPICGWRLSGCHCHRFLHDLNVFARCFARFVEFQTIFNLLFQRISINTGRLICLKKKKYKINI